MLVPPLAWPSVPAFPGFPQGNLCRGQRWTQEASPLPQLGPTSPHRPRPWASLALLVSRIMSPELWSHWIWTCDGVRIIYMWPVSSILNPCLLTGGQTGCESTVTLSGESVQCEHSLSVHPSVHPSIRAFIQQTVSSYVTGSVSGTCGQDTVQVAPKNSKAIFMSTK